MNYINNQYTDNIFDLSKTAINSINYNDYYKEYIISESDKKEFYGEIGQEHYRLLSYISTLFDNSNIIDIGTHTGKSALALSYNSTNTVHTFDIIDKINKENNNEMFKVKRNIKWYIDDIFNSNNKEKYYNLIMSSSIIMLDIDPHNGIMETEFYKYLVQINYKGIIICDDIYYFKEMRDNFWSLIDYKCKIDITQFGHWSGTGLLFTDPNLIPKKVSEHYHDRNNDWTLLTAYFNLTKCIDNTSATYSKDHYMINSKYTLSIPYNLVIYCDEESFEILYSLRPKYLLHKTKFIIKNFEDFTLDGKSFTELRKIIEYNRKVHPYNFDKRNNGSYYLFCLSRYMMLKELIENNPFNSNYFAWINVCIERMGYKNLIHLDEALSVHREKFSTCYIDYIPPELVYNFEEYFKWGRCSMCSGFFTGSKKYMYDFCTHFENIFLEVLNAGYGHADEQLYSIIYFRFPEIFEHYYGDYKEMITNYNYVYDKPESILNIFIQKALHFGNNEKAFEACQKLLSSVIKNKIELSRDDLNKILFANSKCFRNK